MSILTSTRNDLGMEILEEVFLSGRILSRMFCMRSIAKIKLGIDNADTNEDENNDMDSHGDGNEENNVGQHREYATAWNNTGLFWSYKCILM